MGDLGSFVPLIDGTDEMKCPPDKVVFDELTGQYICLEGGYVIGQELDMGPEWRAFDFSEKQRRSRTGGPVNLTVGSSVISSMIDWKDRDATGKKLSPARKAEATRLRRWQIRSRIPDSANRNLQQAMDELNNLSHRLGLNHAIRERVMHIYREALEKGVVRGRAVEAVVAAAVYAACRIERLPRTLDEIAVHTRASKKEIARCYRLLVKELGLRVPIADPKDFIRRIADSLGLSGRVVTEAMKIVDSARGAGLTAGKDPAGLAAAAVYLAAHMIGEKRTQKEVAAVAGVTEVTVRNRYKEITQFLGIVITE